MAWKVVREFRRREIERAFRWADRRAEGLEAGRRRLASSSACALVVGLDEFLEAGVESCVVEPGGDEEHEPRLDARVLFVSAPLARGELEDLLTAIRREGSSSSLPEWLAVSRAWTRETPSGDAAWADLPWSGALLRSGGAPPHAFELRSLATASVKTRLRSLQETRKLGEGPGNLGRRESWFRDKFRRRS